MHLLTSIEALSGVPGPVHLAIGVFDGLHLGHQALCRRAVDGAARDGGSAVVVTFEPHPARVLRPEQAPLLLTCAGHRRILLGRQGVGFTLEIPFDGSFAALPADAFIRSLAAACRPLRRICVGYDWRFGRGREGDVHVLADLGRELGFEVTALPAVTVDGEIVSSTAIRAALAGGDLGKVSRHLGRPYSVWGEVVRGRQVGRELGFATANVRSRNEQLPLPGVYAVVARLGDDRFPAVANLGSRPTIEEQRSPQPVLEVHLLDWDGDLYGRFVEIEFHRRLRAERRFEGVDALRAAIASDVGAARAVFADTGAA